MCSRPCQAQKISTQLSISLRLRSAVRPNPLCALAIYKQDLPCFWRPSASRPQWMRDSVHLKRWLHPRHCPGPTRLPDLQQIQWKRAGIPQCLSMQPGVFPDPDGGLCSPLQQLRTLALQHRRKCFTLSSMHIRLTRVSRAAQCFLILG